MCTFLALFGATSLIYVVQFFICVGYHMVYDTREPRDIRDFFKLMFLPYVVYKHFTDKESLKEE